MRLKIKKMPDKKTLEAYLDNNVKVYFDIEKGEFVWDERFKRHNTSKKRAISR